MGSSINGAGFGESFISKTVMLGRTMPCSLQNYKFRQGNTPLAIVSRAQ